MSKAHIYVQRNPHQNFRNQSINRSKAKILLLKQSRALIKSKTEQRNQSSLALVNVFHSKPLYKHINHGEEASKRRRNHPLEVSLCIGMFRKLTVLGREPYMCNGRRSTSTLFSPLVLTSIALPRPLSLSQTS